MLEDVTIQLYELLALFSWIWWATGCSGSDFCWNERPAIAQAETPCVSRVLPAPGYAHYLLDLFVPALGREPISSAQAGIMVRLNLQMYSVFRVACNLL